MTNSDILKKIEKAEVDEQAEWLDKPSGRPCPACGQPMCNGENEYLGACVTCCARKDEEHGRLR